MLVDYSVHAALWCQRQNQGAFLIGHVYVETAKAWQEHHLNSSRKLMTRHYSSHDTLKKNFYTVLAQVSVCMCFRSYTCLTLTYATPGSESSHSHMKKGSRSLLNAWLSSHNKSSLWLLTPTTQVKFRLHGNQRYRASTTPPPPTHSCLDTTVNITHTAP